MLDQEQIDAFFDRAKEAELEAVKDENDRQLRDTWLAIASCYRDLARLHTLKAQSDTALSHNQIANH